MYPWPCPQGQPRRFPSQRYGSIYYQFTTISAKLHLFYCCFLPILALYCCYPFLKVQQHAPFAPLGGKDGSPILQTRDRWAGMQLDGPLRNFLPPQTIESALRKSSIVMNSKRLPQPAAVSNGLSPVPYSKTDLRPPGNPHGIP